MKWKTNDMEQYVQAKEYIDTLLIPLQPFQITDESALQKDTFQRELLSLYANDIEKELSGRVLLTPTYNYLKTADMATEIKRLNEWINELVQMPFSNVFLLTFELTWKKHEHDINGHLMWLPGISNANLQSKETILLIQNQVEQISQLIRSYW